MSTHQPLALYQIETFGAAGRPLPSRDGKAASAKPAVRASEFLVQLMVGGDGDLRKTLGRQEVASERQSAYGSALSNRPSSRSLSFLRVIDTV